MESGCSRSSDVEEGEITSDDEEPLMTPHDEAKTMSADRQDDDPAGHMKHVVQESVLSEEDDVAKCLKEYVAERSRQLHATEDFGERNYSEEKKRTRRSVKEKTKHHKSSKKKKRRTAGIEPSSVPDEETHDDPVVPVEEEDGQGQTGELSVWDLYLRDFANRRRSADFPLDGSESDSGEEGTRRIERPGSALPSARSAASNICKYFSKGFCRKGDACPFSHDLAPLKKSELCRFYLMSGGCKKRESCLFMHEDFPCKYFHTGVKCYAASKCRFSHKPLTKEMDGCLKKWLEVSAARTCAEGGGVPPTLRGRPASRGDHERVGHDPKRKRNEEKHSAKEGEKSTSASSSVASDSPEHPGFADRGTKSLADVAGGSGQDSRLSKTLLERENETSDKPCSAPNSVFSFLSSGSGRNGNPQPSLPPCTAVANLVGTSAVVDANGDKDYRIKDSDYRVMQGPAKKLTPSTRVGDVDYRSKDTDLRVLKGKPVGDDAEDLYGDLELGGGGDDDDDVDDEDNALLIDEDGAPSPAVGRECSESELKRKFDDDSDEEDAPVIHKKQKVEEEDGAISEDDVDEENLMIVDGEESDDHVEFAREKKASPPERTPHAPNKPAAEDPRGTPEDPGVDTMMLIARLKASVVPKGDGKIRRGPVTSDDNGGTGSADPPKKQWVSPE